ncbi:DUF3667 domain-containing protein [Cytophagaceae bacterium DM2B3-1]|uniref:DUF3667 domain-containing protein n=1 Tax=Xanthocytophaga flava TaxID=3048013 RepID=A0ABT7CH77_9BACT|nr:DUF3667 domain-containing protein [Xanthocytophaga flavus]MDJ1468880.1 DUF3667 domain-containing protein [Xanthocytophaga flavus]MDJ1492054.1 DUF3667 domain-containing protein [Xanthocytophaga flavus]
MSATDLTSTQTETVQTLPLPLTCANCGSELKPTFSFCPDCGQSTEPKVESFGMVVKEFLEDYFSFDSKVFRSLLPLLFRPGFLSIEYIQGRRARYIPPLRMYLTISLLAFLMLAVNKPSRLQYQSDSQEISSTELEELKDDIDEDYAARDQENDIITVEDAFWDSFFDSTLPKLFFVMVPLYGLIQAMLYWRQRRYYMEHLIFSLHFHSFVFVVLLVYMLISSYLLAGMAFLNRTLMLTFTGGILLYLYFALKRVYGQNYFKTSLKFGLLLASYTITFILFCLIALFGYYSFR